MKNFQNLFLLVFLLNLVPKINNAQWVTTYEMVGPAGVINDMDFFKSDTGIIVGFTFDVNHYQHALIMRTTDAGNTWNVITSNTINSNNGIYAVSSVSKTMAYAGGISFLIKTSDGGLTWDSIIFKIDNSTPASNAMIGLMNFTSINDGLAIINPSIFNGGVLSRTSNAGLNWSTILSSVTAYYSKDDKNIYAISNGNFKSSNDSGVSWTSSVIPSDSIIHTFLRPSVYFQNANVGYITKGIHLIKTTDAGNTWSKISIDQNDSFDLTGIQFIDSLTGFITAEMGHFFITNNGGNTWNKGVKTSDFDFIKPYYFSKSKVCMLSQAFDIEDILVNNRLPSLTGINEFQLQNIELNIYPNPATNELHINSGSNEKLNVQIFDITGKQVTESIPFNTSTTISTQSLIQGLYFIRITDANGAIVKTQKIAVVR